MGLRDLIRRSSLPPPSIRGEDDLFDDEFQRKLEYLALVSRRVFGGRLRAERRTKKSGSGIEFADHRDYVPGDDFRYLDWNIYQRLGRLLQRQPYHGVGAAQGLEASQAEARALVLDMNSRDAMLARQLRQLHQARRRVARPCPGVQQGFVHR